ncbi:MAG: DUF1761 domain-containing protein [Candidatus Woesearchaeota archaeon]|nr:DUF1761 domain-containing protein [Candidatus Woesearchaeota archaeon]
MAFQLAGISLFPVLGAAVTAMAIGAFWYSPACFGKVWIKLSGVSDATMQKAKKNGMGKYYAAAFLSNVVMAFVLSLVIKEISNPGAIAGAFIGVLVWLGFIATVSLGMVLWEGKPFKLYLLNNAHELVILVVMGAILGAF